MALWPNPALQTAVQAEFWGVGLEFRVLGFRVWGLGFRVWVLAVWCLGFLGLGFGVSGYFHLKVGEGFRYWFRLCDVGV